MAGNSNRSYPTLKWSIQVGIINLIFVAVLFISAGDAGWVMGWVYTGVLVFNQILTAFLVIRNNPELAEERMQIKAAPIAPWDRRLAGIMAFTGPIAFLLVAGLDRRFKWSPELPFWLQVAALAIIVLGSLITIWAMSSNQFFYGHVRIEKERGHRVTCSGPYGYVRHPGYAGAYLFDLASPFALGSLWALIPAILTVCAIVARTALEDQLLQAELDGYREYAQQVRYRLLPGIW